MSKQLNCILIILLITLLGIRSSQAQDAIFSQFFSSSIYLNPAFAGSGEGFRAVLNYRNHPLKGSSSFSHMNVAIDQYVPALYGGLGLIVTSDYQGGFSWKNHIDLAYAFHVKLTQDLYMNFALQAGYYRRDIRWGDLDFYNNYSQPPPPEDFSHSPNFAAGFIIYNHWIYGGIASHHLSEPAESSVATNVLPRKHTAHVGLYLRPSTRRRANTLLFDYFISPNIIFQNQGQFYRINYGLHFGIESLMAGVWYRQFFDHPGTLVFLAGVSIGDYRIGYSYDYTLSGFAGAHHGVHEISLTFNFLPVRERVIRVPSYL